MKASAFAFVVSAMAATVHAGDADDFSLMRCGVVFGGKTLTYTSSAASERKSEFDTRMNHVLGAVQEKPAQFTPAQSSAPFAVGNSTMETRLPPKFTLATIGCSWR